MTVPELTIAVVYPDLLGTYGDGGNGVVLARRAQWRGVKASLVEVSSDERLPEADIYCLGGGEDGPQAQAADALAADGGLTRAAARGAVILAVCAGYQIVGSSFPSADGRSLPGLGLLDVSTVKFPGRRAVGELWGVPVDAGPGRGLARLPPLTGFENHGGRTTLGPGASPLARVTVGVGNGDGATEGAWQGRIVGTYLHGPLLARNPALADRLLGWALGDDQPLAPLDLNEVRALRAERHQAVLAGRWSRAGRGLKRLTGIGARPQ